ncbi:cytochrome C oxidase subunit II [Rhodohalobacter sp. SW132]|uniref:cytochrome c oxidase subunit II n=1 Tax=Rhodohalobacter sp. SW132 TaxID=2293433 RepID=UPI000E246A8F|nr:cytochrome c oxidase subunit II [Rhodohalobacter sp. SW132]REL38794.1 cytochrome C oxidase subunit II [Rhodohalobacter sp. SW132]
MDKSEKLALTLSALLLGVFFASIIYASTAKDIDVPTCITDFDPFLRDTLFQTGPDTYELQMVARMWAFAPSTIRLPKGSTVDLYVTSQDIIHGFKVERKNLNLMAVPGAINYMRVTFDEAGEYLFACHEFCGAAHHTMAGRFIIEEGIDEPETED